MESQKTLQKAIQYFSDFENCQQFMIANRWADGKVRCPQCGSLEVKYLPNARLYKCYEKHPRQKFSLKVGTVFEDSPIPLEKWLPAVWLIVNCKNGISSYEISRALGVTQKSAWFMLHRIRKAMQDGTLGSKLGGNGGEVEADETFIGGKARNMHKSVKARRITGQGHNTDDKIMVMGILERGGRVRAQIVADRKQETLHGTVRANVEAGTALFTDTFGAYKG